jgi:hypothetical protein
LEKRNGTHLVGKNNDFVDGGILFVAQFPSDRHDDNIQRCKDLPL